ncbi:MAG: insulinase family protein [Flavobacteriaceae bacterium]|nr:insulinase family protein [Flavobacteriaceae bacterium]
MRKTLFIIAIISLFITSCKQNKKAETGYEVQSHTDSNGFVYETVTNDPTGLRLYTLENGLKVYLSRNTEEPKIQTFIPVRAGSVYDPKDNTGLAHYLEHMVFKGTDEIGTQNWEEEKVLLTKISDLYEKHKAEIDPSKKEDIYREIDKVSYEASKLTIANEYDKMVSMLGATGTNAWTWHEETVYVNKIPSNALDKWLHLESERFSQVVLRIFHTELEAVFEEFNRGQDSDGRRSAFALNEALFPKHPYGQQTTIGTAEHLKNPSMVAINEYFNKYYVPNNMAVILVGDLEFDETIKKVNESFGKMEYKEVSHPERPTEEPLTSIVKREVNGPENERLTMAFRSSGIGSEDEVKIQLIDMLLSNSTAGLIDLNLNQKQLVQRAGCYTLFLNDYGMHSFYGTPKSGQTLEEVEALIVEQIEEIKKGNFDDWMIDAVINDLKLSQIKNFEESTNVAQEYVGAFVHFQDWKDRVSMFDKMRKVSKQELVDFANKFYNNNYAVVYKRQGEATDLVKVKNPGITPVELNRGKRSPFFDNFAEMKSPDLQPKFVDYNKAIKNTKSNGLEVAYIPNDLNDYAELSFIFDMGSRHNKKLGLAVGYLDYLGTEKYSPEALQKEFYKIGIQFGVRRGADRSVVTISGLKENLDKGLVLLEDLWANAVADQETYDKYVLKIAKGREDNKANKGSIMWSGLMSYGQYGENSPLRDIFTIAELKAMDPKELVELVKDLRNYKQRIFYYGKDLDKAIASVEKHHQLPGALKEYPEERSYAKKETGGNVYFVNYDMVQTEMMFLSKGKEFDPSKMAAARLFNSYFGSGFNSIFFQDLRESKSLAYSAFSAYSSASKKGDPDYVYGYIGTQANKMPEAIDAVLDLMQNMPKAEENFKTAKDASMKRLAAQRINKTDIFWSYEGLKKRGITEDNRKQIYEAMQNMTLEDVYTFYEENIKDGKYDLLVIGNKKDVDIKAMEKVGKVQELDVDYLFNYEKPLPIKS